MLRFKDIYEKIFQIVMRYYKTTSLFLGISATGALPPFFHTWCLLAFCGVAVLGCVKQNAKQLVAIGYWFGFGFFSFGFYWIGNALLIAPQQTGWLYPFVLVLNGVFFGLFVILPILIMKWGKTTLSKILFMSAGWFLSAEWLRSVFLTGFPWNPLSSVLAFDPVWLQTLSLWGTYGLSIVVLLIVTLPVVWFLKPCCKNVYAPIVSLLGILFLYGYGEYSLVQFGSLQDGEQIRVRLVQPSIPQSMKWNKTTVEENFADYIGLSQGSGLEYIDFVVWGETASPFNLLYDVEHRLMAQEAIPPQGYLLTGMLQDGYDSRTGDYVLYNSFFVMDYFGRSYDVYSKSHLVPFGEYIPLRSYLPHWVKPLTNMVAQFAKGRKYQTIKLDGYAEFAPLICYEIIFSGQIVRWQNKPKWAVVLTNDGWYGISAGPYQHLVATQMRAVEEGISIVRAANSGISAVINPVGVITSQIGLSERGYVDDTVKIDMSHNTLFGQYGNKIPFIISCFLIVFALLLNRRKSA